MMTNAEHCASHICGAEEMKEIFNWIDYRLFGVRTLVLSTAELYFQVSKALRGLYCLVSLPGLGEQWLFFAQGTFVLYLGSPLHSPAKAWPSWDLGDAVLDPSWAGWSRYLSPGHLALRMKCSAASCPVRVSLGLCAQSRFPDLNTSFLSDIPSLSKNHKKPRRNSGLLLICPLIWKSSEIQFPAPWSRTKWPWKSSLCRGSDLFAAYGIPVQPLAGTAGQHPAPLAPPGPPALGFFPEYLPPESVTHSRI